MHRTGYGIVIVLLVLDGEKIENKLDKEFLQ
jgi:hypothetical protein